MEITCRRADQGRFEALGFTAQEANNATSPFVVMVDEEANYGHSGNLPTDIPYHGFNGPGGNFGDGVCACDGQVYADVDTGHGGGFVVDWDEEKQQPTPRSLETIRRYLTTRKKVGEMFAGLAPTE
jgi:hypothetical protein